jgi:hypothetical protein
MSTHRILDPHACSPLLLVAMFTRGRQSAYRPGKRLRSIDQQVIGITIFQYFDVSG